ncbi:hypothetical protein SEA_OTTAWA_20 [Arthrobacter phage Ottawa]|nr:hypothetical protein SEA_KHARCHO_20 [Arthrobacter phage Kharcho]WIC89252.1 hypothetical protein SEA_OTTAWA_20 [Arthrobacter phage Ottawa]
MTQAPDPRYTADVRAEALRAALAVAPEETTPGKVIAAAEAFESYLLGHEVVGPDAATAAELVTILQDATNAVGLMDDHETHLRLRRGLEIATKIMEDAEGTE